MDLTIFEFFEIVFFRALREGQEGSFQEIEWTHSLPKKFSKLFSSNMLRHCL